VIDLHTHSTQSDGKDSPTRLVELASQQGITVLGITDHDSTRGWEEAIAAGRKFGVGIVPGIEISTRSETAAGRGISVHMLCYLPDPNNQALLKELEATRESRVTRAKKMVELLAKDYPISWELVLSQLPAAATIGRPAIADALVELGIVPNRSDAFTSILNSSGRYYISEHSLETEYAIKLIREAGGVSVMAHPLIDFPAGKSPADLPSEHFEKLIAAGLDGLEIDHRAVPEHAKAWLRSLALKHDLIITGSSDYHGVGGKDNELGENQTSQAMLDRIIDQASGSQSFL
jgi:predicted metal-dependent phosphoesterase TrpH